jgi:peptidyl-prolyl cis-trans isomerase B (cyclophilin B)
VTLAAFLDNFAVMKAINLLCAFGLFAAVAIQAEETSTNPPTAPVMSTPATNEVALIKTTEGDMVVEFWADAAPKTIENFKTLARKGFYDGTCFHRVIKGFMIQGGDPLTKDPSKEAMWGTGGPGYQIKAEFNDHSHKRGVISMARSNDPDSAGSQFFICHGDPTFLDHQYTTFGKLIKGDDVLEKIGTTPTHPQDRPDKRMGIISITIVPRDSVK